MAAKTPNLQPTWANIAPNLVQLGPTWDQNRPSAGSLVGPISTSWPKMVPRGSQDALNAPKIDFEPICVDFFFEIFVGFLVDFLSLFGFSLVPISPNLVQLGVNSCVTRLTFGDTPTQIYATAVRRRRDACVFNKSIPRFFVFDK